jgi:hypothetical protein
MLQTPQVPVSKKGWVIDRQKEVIYLGIRRYIRKGLCTGEPYQKHCPVFAIYTNYFNILGHAVA